MHLCTNLIKRVKFCEFIFITIILALENGKGAKNKYSKLVYTVHYILELWMKQRLKKTCKKMKANKQHTPSKTFAIASRWSMEGLTFDGTLDEYNISRGIPPWFSETSSQSLSCHCKVQVLSKSSSLGKANFHSLYTSSSPSKTCSWISAKVSDNNEKICKIHKIFSALTPTKYLIN